MWMVIGEQRGLSTDAGERSARLKHMAEVTRQSPGFVRGWWGADDTDPEVMHVLVMLDSLENAQALKQMVEQNVTGVRLRIMEVDVEVPEAG
ncbi:hypothetical protein ACFY2R_09730 [Micromonospora olivasterospora]|uniref:Uncharacterized protein n=1 Tax=Micromonospora olivasterospora TaxID=1880 RepID=A0A562I6L6_MICOL|nr:hypothetical protein [Micromonospora olivasterospora]TWH66651.1 hypothetical protein JD77_01608 [Micromonospora olivasterospora]